MMTEMSMVGSGWIPEFGTVLVDGFNGQQNEREDELEEDRQAERDAIEEGLIEPTWQSEGMGEICESNKVDPNSKDTDTLEQAERKAGLRPLF
jgi:hypothetical protein